MKSLCFFLMLFMGAWSAQAATETDLLVESLNYRNSLSDMVSVAKENFGGERNHELIDKQIDPLKKLIGKWNWRFENVNETVAFRLNGQIQHHVKPVDPINWVYELNGKNLVFKPGMSFEEFGEAVTKILNAKTARMEGLFFDRADAFFPPLGLFSILAVNTIMFDAAQRKQATQNCNYYDLDLGKVFPPNIRSNNFAAFYDSSQAINGFKYGKVCRRNNGAMPSTPERRIGQLAKNFLPSGKFYRAASQYAQDPTALRSVMYSNCIFQTQQPCADLPGSVTWNMTRQMAQESCNLGLAAYTRCEFPERAVVVPVKVSVPKKRKGSVTQPVLVAEPPPARSVNSVPDCIKDKTGLDHCPPPEVPESEFY